ncbi:MAG: hypothetical protein AAF743_07285 [Planctomycetota bacterium]
MTESDFWLHLEFRLSGDLNAHPVTGPRRFWCDGFDPVNFRRLTRTTWHVDGHVCTGSSGQERWPFAARLTDAASCREQIVWADLIPEQDNHEWFDLDLDERQLWFKLPSA